MLGAEIFTELDAGQVFESRTSIVVIPSQRESAVKPVSAFPQITEYPPLPPAIEICAAPLQAALHSASL